jgi:hypothetical protein
MAATRRSVLGLFAGTATLAFGGCSLQGEHDDQIRVENLRSNAVSLEITASPVGNEGEPLDQSLTLDPGEVEYIADPARAGRGTSAVRIEVATDDGLRANREWEPANVATQLKIYIEPDSLTWDVGPPE